MGYPLPSFAITTVLLLLLQQIKYRTSTERPDLFIEEGLWIWCFFCRRAKRGHSSSDFHRMCLYAFVPSSQASEDTWIPQTVGGSILISRRLLLFIGPLARDHQTRSAINRAPSAVLLRSFVCLFVQR